MLNLQKQINELRIKKYELSKEPVMNNKDDASKKTDEDNKDKQPK